MGKIILLVTLIFPMTACASSMTIERKDYILSRPHGFIEITISDNNIPNIASERDKKELVKPTRCYLRVKAGSEPLFAQDVFPDGSEPPYKVKSGFRFPIPIGEQELKLHYHNCRLSIDGETESIYTSTYIMVQQNRVYEIIFSDGQIINTQEKPNEVVTLKQILDAIKNNK